ncbi:MAG: ImmA/IrrE family metallo-endopeptidase [Clostridia bacterium]|nr:ImmA/IrrE family metallo-endopeptidase [Clostridia bacterium]
MSTSRTIAICAELSEILEQCNNINFLSKEELYTLIEFVRIRFGIDPNRAFNISEFCQKNFKDIIEYDFHKFKDTRIGGFLVKNKLPEKSYITVNSAKDPYSLIFDLTHEMIHFLLHPEDRRHYISSSFCDIDNFEWQANEGAAELLIPYKQFIPQFVRGIWQCKSRADYLNLVKLLSSQYVVSTSVLEYRIVGLSYEISQFEEGVKLENLELLSRRAQEKQGIYMISYKERFSSNSANLKFILSQYRKYG